MKNQLLDERRQNLPPPAGLAVNTAYARISGTPIEACDFVVPLSAQNAKVKAKKQLSLKITPAPKGLTKFGHVADLNSIIDLGEGRVIYELHGDAAAPSAS